MEIFNQLTRAMVPICDVRTIYVFLATVLLGKLIMLIFVVLFWANNSYYFDIDPYPFSFLNTLSAVTTCTDSIKRYILVSYS